MDSWDATTPSPNLKFENSPAESFLSTPGDMYPPLFNASSGSTMNPLEMMTPQPVEDDADADVDVDSLADLTLPDIPESPEESGEKKPVKKRKSWGQVLPEPKTNLPPRKRAKTEDEKEQRRVERVLRNRRAAQSSRERKRLEVEALEKRNKQLEAALIQARQANLALMEQVHNLQRGSGVAPAPFRTSPTFSQELFSSQDGSVVKLEQGQSFEDILSSVSNNTVNPASLSPILTPVPEDEQEEEDEPESAAAPAAGVATTNASPDASHPAVMCSDLQCRSAEAPQWLASQQPSHPALHLSLLLQLLLTSTSTMLSLWSRPLMRIAMSLRAGYSLPPTPVILNTIIWLVTTPLPSPSPKATTSNSSTSTNSSMTSSTCSPMGAQSRTRLASTLRLKSLRKILTSSPILARPLTDATMAVLRLVSTEERDVFPGSDAESEFEAANPWRNGAELPSKEVLLTLLWAIKVEERRMEIRNR
ncbi:hypothetical protein GQ53DRAFT_604833, partial [Thozetella sp. PMI_491]